MTEGKNDYKGVDPRSLSIGIHALDMMVCRGFYSGYDEASQALLPLLTCLRPVRRVPGLLLYDTRENKKARGVRQTCFYQAPGNNMVFVVEDYGNMQHLRTVLVPTEGKKKM